MKRLFKASCASTLPVVSVYISIVFNPTCASTVLYCFFTLRQSSEHISALLLNCLKREDSVKLPKKEAESREIEACAMLRQRRPEKEASEELEVFIGEIQCNERVQDTIYNMYTICIIYTTRSLGAPPGSDF